MNTQSSLRRLFGVTICVMVVTAFVRLHNGSVAFANIGPRFVQLPSEDSIRWHPRSRYLLTKWGIVPLNRKARVAKELAFKRDAFAGCDWNGEGNRVIFSWGGSEITLVPIDKFKPIKLVTAAFGENNFAPAWEPSGKRVAFLSHKRFGDKTIRLCVVDAHGSKPKVLIPNGVISDRPLWSPKGRKVLVSVKSNSFNSPFPSFTTLFVDVETGQTQRVTLRGVADYYTPHACWSPDGQAIVFSAALNDFCRQTGLYIFHLRDRSTSTLIPASNRGADPERLHPAWSPDGKLIAYVKKEDNDEIAVISVVTKEERVVFKSSKTDTGLIFPSWSPDGRWLAFWKREQGSKKRLLRISVKGRRQVEVLR